MENISDLTSLVRLESIDLSRCGLETIPNLGSLTHLTFLKLSSNNLTSLSNLVRSANLGSGFVLDVLMNPLDCTDTFVQNELKALRARGVTVRHECSDYVPSDTCY
jgi:Leucine-rich repeat (LRR) protein